MHDLLVRAACTGANYEFLFREPFLGEQVVTYHRINTVIWTKGLNQHWKAKREANI